MTQLAQPIMEKGDAKLIRKAFCLAITAYGSKKHISGKFYMHYAIEVGQIVINKIGLGTTSLICTLLHKAVQDRSVTLDEIKKELGPKTMQTIIGLNKLTAIFKINNSVEAKDLKKLLLTIFDDLKIILISIAEQLQNMRTLSSIPKKTEIQNHY